jgi:hypothetical protein
MTMLCGRCRTPLPGTSFTFPLRCEPCQEAERREREEESQRYWAQPCYSACSVGKTRWYWVAYPSRNAAWDKALPPASGYAATRENAEAAAMAAVPGAVNNGNFQARGRHRTLAAERRTERLASKPPKTADTAPIEYLYSSWLSDYDNEYRWTQHRIIKRTAKKVFVEDESFGTRVLDREKLEREGYAFGGRIGHTMYYTEKAMQEREAQRYSYRPPCVGALGLSWPCTLDDIKRAWRGLARKLHPDHGGDAAAFRDMRSHYETALRLVGGA